VPGEKLLEFNVKQGWGLMCETLGCEALDWEFSRVNVRIFFVAHRVRFFEVLGWFRYHWIGCMVHVEKEVMQQDIYLFIQWIP